MAKPKLEITRSGDTITISTDLPAMLGRELKKFNLEDNDALLLTLKMDFNADELAAALGQGKSKVGTLLLKELPDNAYKIVQTFEGARKIVEFVINLLGGGGN